MEKEEQKEIAKLVLAQLHYENMAIFEILRAIIPTENGSDVIRRAADDFESKYIQRGKKIDSI